MIYLDYSATTPVNKEVQKSFLDLSEQYLGNPQSIHYLGIKNSELIKEATKQIANLLHIKETEIIYTSGATEGNNWVIKMVADNYQNRGRKILTSKLEHSSVSKPLAYLEKKGFIIEEVDLKQNGEIDLTDFQKKLTADVILVSIGSVNSEIGIKQPIKQIAKYLKDHQAYFHCDVTQSIGKEKISFNGIDFATFSAHKFYGIKGIGVLFKKDKIKLEPLIHGSGIYNRAGTPPLELIVTMSKALRLSLTNLTDNQQKVLKLKNYLISELTKMPKIIINSNDNCLPHIVNFSVLDKKASMVMQALSAKEIYISTQTACRGRQDYSLSVLALTNDKKRAESSLRVSISHLTTKKELEIFCQEIKKII